MVFHHGVTFGLVTSIMTNCHSFVNQKNKRTKIKHLDSASSKRNQDETSLVTISNELVLKVTSMLVTDVGDTKCVGDKFEMFVTDSGC